MTRDEIINALGWHSGTVDNGPQSLLIRIERVVAQAVAAERSIAGWEQRAKNAEAERNALLDLIGRIRKWDHLSNAGDGPFWQREIDAAIAAVEGKK